MTIEGWRSQERRGAEIKRFSPEERGVLEGKGYIILELTGQSITSERARGRKFYSEWHEEDPRLEGLTSMRAEIAVSSDPKKILIPKSNNKTIARQGALIGKVSNALGKEIPGIAAIMGGMPDYVDLAFAYFDATGRYLFGEEFFGGEMNFKYARTNTSTIDKLNAIVGFGPSGLFVGHWLRDESQDDIFAFPLIVPEGKMLPFPKQ